MRKSTQELLRENYRATKQRPCPVCGKPDRCLIAKDGATAICYKGVLPDPAPDDERDHMSEQPSEWAMGEARKIVGKICSIYRTVGDSMYDEPKSRIVLEIALALDAARKVPDGCVRLPDGRDVKVLGTLPMTADGCVIGEDAPPVWCWGIVTINGEDVEGVKEWEADYDDWDCPVYSTREAAEAARKVTK